MVFTTHKKAKKTTIDISRKGSIVKERCKQFAELINFLFPGQVVSDEDLTELIEDKIGGNKETIRAYKGYSGHIRAGRCGDNHVVGLSRKGYLERYGFLVRRGRNWVVCQALLSSQGIMKGDVGVGDGERLGLVSNEKISISASQPFTPKGKGSEGKPILEVSLSSREREEEEDTEKERNFTPKISPMISDEDDANLAYLKRLAEAKPLEEVTAKTAQSEENGEKHRNLSPMISPMIQTEMSPNVPKEELQKKKQDQDKPEPAKNVRTVQWGY